MKTEILNLFAQFMHIYFWAFIILSTLVTFVNLTSKDYKDIKPTKQMSLPFWALVGWVLFIMSFKY